MKLTLTDVSGVHALSVNKQKHVQGHENQDDIEQVIVTNVDHGSQKSKDLERINQDFILQYDIQNEGTLVVKFKTPLQKKTTSTIRVFFELINPTSGVYFVNTNQQLKLSQAMKDRSNSQVASKILNGPNGDSEMDTNDDNENGDNENPNGDNDKHIRDEDTLRRMAMPHMYTQSQIQGARCWFPCVDLLSSYHFFEFEITSHAESMIVCSGDLIRQVENYSGTLKTAYFKTNSIMPPSSVCLAVGPFNISYSTLSLGSYDLMLNAFYLPNYSLESIRHTLGFVKRAFLFIEEFLDLKYYDLFNTKTFNIVFIESGYIEQSGYASVCLVDSNKMILDPTAIDPVQENRTSLTRLISEQYFGNVVHSKSWSDYWLIEGIAGYLSLQFYESEFGLNAKRFKMMQEGKELLRLEKHTQTLYSENYAHPSELVTEYMKKKAPLVIYMIDRQVSTSNMRKLLNRILNAAVQDNNSKRYTDRQISTSSFIKVVEKTFATDLKQFAAYWIYGTGVPQFACSFKYDVMRSCVDLKVKQVLPCNELAPFRGKVTLRISETEGSPNDILMDLDKEENQFEFHINSKPVKKQHKKLTGATTEANRIIIPLKWIRFDPEQDWIKVLSFSQTQEMWLYQIEEVKDVVSQYEAINALTFFKDTERIVLKLMDILTDNSYYYQIRVCAAHALSKIPQRIVKRGALDRLISFFKQQFFDDQWTYLKPNNFKNFAEYFLKKEIPLALTNFLDEKVNNETQPEVIQFLLDLIKYNDDSENLYSGDFYTSNLLKALSLVNTPNLQFKSKIEKIFHKYLVIDSDLIPSYHHIKTVSALEGIAHLQSCGKSKINLEFFFRYMDFKQSDFVRFAAWKSVLEILDSIPSLENVTELISSDSKPILSSKGDLNEIYTHELLSSVRFVFFKYLSLIRDETETPYMKYEISNIVSSSILKSSAQMLMQYMLNDKKLNDNLMKKVSALGFFLICSRCPSATNRKVVDEIWDYLKNSSFTKYDFRLRTAIMTLFKSIWSGLPLCYDPKVMGTSKIDLALLLAPSLYGISDLKIVQPHQLDSHRYLASDPCVIFDWSNLSKSILAPAIEAKTPQASKKSTSTTPSKVGSTSVFITPLKTSSVESTPKKDSKKSTTKKDSSKKTSKDTKSEKDKKSKDDKEKKSKDESKSDEKKRKRSESKDKKEKPKKKKEPSPETKIKIKLETTPPPSAPSSSDEKSISSITPPVLVSANSQAAVDLVTTGSEPPANYKTFEQEKALMQQKSKLREERTRRNASSRIVCINMTGSETRMYVVLDEDSTTANAIFRSLPMLSSEVVGAKGMIYFSLTSLEHVDEEPAARCEVKNGELAYWTSGSSIVIGYSKTLYSLASEIRLYQPCNIFGELLYPAKSLNRNVMQQPVYISRLPRFCIHIPAIDQTINIDLFEHEFPDICRFVVKEMPLTKTFMPPFGKLLYFNMPENSRQFLRANYSENDKFFRDYLFPGEIAYWAEGNAILLGTGPTAVSQTKQDKYPLLSKCYIIGKITSSNYLKLIDNLPQSPAAVIHLCRREILMSIEVEGGSTTDLVIGVANTVTGDTLFDACCSTPIVLEHKDVSIIEPAEDTCALLSLQVDEKNPSISALQHEVNVSSRQLKKSEIGFLWDTYSIVLPFQHSEVEDAYILPDDVNVWGRFKQSLTNPTQDYVSLLNWLSVQKITHITLSKYIPQ